MCRRYKAELTGQQFVHVLAALAAVGRSAQMHTQLQHDRVGLEVLGGVFEPPTGARGLRRQLQQQLTACRVTEIDDI